jgi:hypothetical protein
MFGLARMFVVVALIALTGCATSPEPNYQATPETTLNIFTAVLRYRIAKTPLARHRDLHVFMNNGIIPGLPVRFPEFHVVVHSGSQGSSPPRARWYFLWLTRVTADKAFVYVEAVEASGHFVELRMRDGKWIVVDDRKFYLT